MGVFPIRSQHAAAAVIDASVLSMLAARQDGDQCR
jgi:hypothetical protein